MEADFIWLHHIATDKVSKGFLRVLALQHQHSEVSCGIWRQTVLTAIHLCFITWWI